MARTRRRVAPLVAVAALCVVGPLTMAVGPSVAAPAADVEELACPAALDGVALALDEEFAGTPRALANDAGILVRFTLRCPYHRPDGTSVADLTMAWSRYAAEDLRCRNVELVSEPAEDGRVQGVVDHPSLSARVTFGAASPAVVPAVAEAATELLADTPSDAFPCTGGEASGVDADLALPTAAASSSGPAPVALAFVLLATTAAVLAVLVALLGRRVRRRRRVAAEAAAEPEAGALAAALRQQRLAATAANRPPGDAAGSPAAALAVERQNAIEILRGATARQAAIEQGLAEARRDVALHRQHAEAVRRLARSVGRGSGAEFLSSYAGAMTLAVAATNLVSTSARRAVSLIEVTAGPGAACGEEGEVIERLHGQVVAAAESGLGDTRFWLWQDRRMAVVAALRTLERLAPRLVVLQQRLVAEVADLARQHAAAGEEAEWARGVIADADRRLADPDATAGSLPPLERAGV